MKALLITCAVLYMCTGGTLVHAFINYEGDVNIGKLINIYLVNNLIMEPKLCLQLKSKENPS